LTHCRGGLHYDHHRHRFEHFRHRLLCWLLFTLAVYALPFLAGLTASLAAFDSGSGAIGALVVGVLVGGATLAIGQIAFAAFRPPPIRAAIALLYMAPATIAGYHATLGFAHIGVPSESWREALAMVGAVFVGATAFIRIPRPAGQRIVEGPASPSFASVSRKGEQARRRH
jgi:hypothetical protein